MIADVVQVVQDHEQSLAWMTAAEVAEGFADVQDPFATTKLKALLWCAQHEMSHAGQIGLLRRHLGFPPMW